MGGGSESAVEIGSLTSGATSAVLSLASDWTSGYCANVTIGNSGSTATTTWQVVINLNQSTLANIWSATDSISGAQMTAGPFSYNASIAPGGSTTFGFCGNATGSNYRPTIVSVSASGNAGGSTSTGGIIRHRRRDQQRRHHRQGRHDRRRRHDRRGWRPRVEDWLAVARPAPAVRRRRDKAPAVRPPPAVRPAGPPNARSRGPPTTGRGSFTWYYFGQGTGQDNLGYRTACGYTGKEPSGMDSDTVMNIATPGYFAAVPGATGSNFETVNHCGACAQITNGARSVIVTIVDECPENSNPVCASNPNGHLDLSRPAFNALGYRPAIRSGTTWKYVPCRSRAASSSGASRGTPTRSTSRTSCCRSRR